MGYFDSEENVESYIKMVDGYDGAALVEVLTRHLPDGSTVLELGMGPGKDLQMLSKHFKATGSDSSMVFVDRYAPFSLAWEFRRGAPRTSVPTVYDRHLHGSGWKPFRRRGVLSLRGDGSEGFSSCRAKTALVAT